MNIVKNFIIGCLITVGLAQPQAYAEDIRGNGGDLIVCRGSSNEIISTELLDQFEGRVQRNIQPALPQGLSDPTAIALAVIDRLAVVDSHRQKMLKGFVRNFARDTAFLSGITLVDIPDSAHIVLPRGCTLEQFAIRKDPEFPGDKLFTVNNDLWEASSPEVKASLILHEAIYAEAIAMGQINSINTRYYNSLLTSEKFLAMPLVDYLVVLKAAGLPYKPGTVSPGPCRGANVPGDYATLQEGIIAMPNGTFCIVGEAGDVNLSGYTVSITIVGQGARGPVGLNNLTLGVTGNVTIRDIEVKMLEIDLGKDSNLTLSAVAADKIVIGGRVKMGLLDRVEVRDSLGVQFGYPSGFNDSSDYTSKYLVQNSYFNKGVVVVTQQNSSIGSENRLASGVFEMRNCTFYGDGTRTAVTLNQKTGARYSSSKTVDLSLHNSIVTNYAVGVSVKDNEYQRFKSSHNAVLGNNQNYAGYGRFSETDFRGIDMMLYTTADWVRPLADSPLVGFGEVSEGVTEDFFGNPRSGRNDVGAIQVGGS